MGKFQLSDPKPARTGSTGTEVEIANIQETHSPLLTKDAVGKLAEIFAVYLLNHSQVYVSFDGVRVDPEHLQVHVESYPVIGVEDDKSQPIQAEVTVVEWMHKTGRELVLCDSNGCVLGARKLGIHTPGFTNFGAYLKSDFLRDNQDVIDIDHMHPALHRLIEESKAIVRSHFRKRAAEQARSVVEKWKEESIYPYDGLPDGPVEEAERQVFDIVALNITESLPDLAPTGASKKVTFQILRAAIEQSPDTVRRIFHEVLDLPEARRQQLVELLDHTTLASLITANKVVVDRLRFLAGLEVVLFEHELRRKTKERQHLHKLIEGEAWLFGEHYHLGISDQGLEAVLRKHESVLGRQPSSDDTSVVRPDGKQGIVDLMLSRQVVLPRGNEFEHLVVELKRPSQKINSQVIQQVKQYAFAVAGDERFSNSHVRWAFWALSNDMDAFAQHEANQSGREPGVIFQSIDGTITIWAKTWGQLLDEAKGRMRFYREALDLKVSHEEGLKYLQQVHSDHLPKLSV